MFLVMVLQNREGFISDILHLKEVLVIICGEVHRNEVSKTNKHDCLPFNRTVVICNWLN